MSIPNNSNSNYNKVNSSGQVDKYDKVDTLDIDFDNDIDNNIKELNCDLDIDNNLDLDIDNNSKNSKNMDSDSDMNMDMDIDKKISMIDDLVYGFCSGEDYQRLLNISRRWKIGKRDAAELMVNVDIAQSFIMTTWL